MRAVRVIDDVATLKAMADPTRAAILELLTEPRSATELAARSTFLERGCTTTSNFFATRDWSSRWTSDAWAR